MVVSRYYAACLLGCVLLGVCQAAAPPAAKNAMELESLYPDMSTGLKAIKNNNKDLAAYLSDPDSVCTLFVPTNKAMSDWMRWFGKYAGKAVQNTTFMTSALNYHTIPGQAFTADQIAKGGRQLTRANETVYFWKQGGQPRVYSRRDYPVSLNQTNIKAGGCIVHSVNMAMVPPTSNDMVNAWVDEIGLMPDAGPESQWAPKQQPLPNSLEASAPAGKGQGAGSDSAVAATPAGGASKPASSGVGLATVDGVGSSLVLAAVAAAVLL